eukprot:g31814.t1
MFSHCCASPVDTGQERIPVMRVTMELPPSPSTHGVQEFIPHCYQLPTFCDGDTCASKERAEVRPAHTFANGSTYTGEWLGLVRHGYGKQVWPDGARYEGQWCHDMANGMGRFQHGDGDVYEGQWKNDKAEGLGKYTQLVLNDMLGWGGMWQDSVRQEDAQHGYGIETWPDGAKYLGLYENGLKAGKGCFTWVDESTYFGDFKDNDIAGHGM